VRKISGFHKPSKANQEAFERAVREIAESSDRLLKAMGEARPAREAAHGGTTSSGLNPAAG
jgi:hypothetical protein